MKRHNINAKNADIYVVNWEIDTRANSQHHQSRDPVYATCTPSYPTEYRNFSPCLAFPSKTFVKCLQTQCVHRKSVSK